MRLYKYKSLSNLWHVLDIVIHRRLYCARWSELNDPLEGRYEIYLGEQAISTEGAMVGQIERAREDLRIASLSADPTNFLLWSHYADGHKGVAIEMEIPNEHADLLQVTYSPFSSVFTEYRETKGDLRHLFNGKSEEWSYEKEYRVVIASTHFQLPSGRMRVLLGPRASEESENILRKILPADVPLVKTRLNRVQGNIEIVQP